MNAKSLLSLIAAMLFSLSAHAHDCSGGANGGTDATGNQCNDGAVVATVVSSDSATPTRTNVPMANTKKVASHSNNAGKHTVTARHPSVRSQSKNS